MKKCSFSIHFNLDHPLILICFIFLMMPPLQAFNKKDKQKGTKVTYTSLIDVSNEENNGEDCQSVTDDDEDLNFNESSHLISSENDSNSLGLLNGLRDRLNHKRKPSARSTCTTDHWSSPSANYDSDECLALSPIRPKSYSDKPKASIHCIERRIEPGDTLQSLSLKCGCTISQLKRANNLMSDQEFFGLTTVKIPVRGYGLLSQVFREQKSSRSSTNADLHHREERLVSVGFKHTFNSDRDDSDIRSFMDNLDKDLQDIRGKVNSSIGRNDELSSTAINLSTSWSEPSNPSNNSKVVDGDSIDSGLTLFHVIAIALCVCIVIPVIYVWLFEEKQLVKTHH